MQRYKLVIEYCGTLYNGWQNQKKNNHKTIQEIIEVLFNFFKIKYILKKKRMQLNNLLDMKLKLLDVEEQIKEFIL